RSTSPRTINILGPTVAGLCFYSTPKRRSLQMREARRLTTCGPDTRLGSDNLFIPGFGAANEGGHVLVEFLKRGIVYVDHVTGLIPVVLNVLRELGGDGQVLVLVKRRVEGRREIVVAAVDHDLELGIGFHGGGQILAYIQPHGVPVVLPVPTVAVELGLGQVAHAGSELQVAPDIGVEQCDIRRGDGGTLRIVLGFFAERIEAGAREARVETPGGQ